MAARKRGDDPRSGAGAGAAGANVGPTSAKTVYRVLPLERGWRIELAGDSVHELAPDRVQAIARARELASRAPIGSVVVLGPDGRVEMEIDVAPRARPI